MNCNYYCNCCNTQQKSNIMIVNIPFFCFPGPRLAKIGFDGEKVGRLLNIRHPAKDLTKYETPFRFI